MKIFPQQTVTYTTKLTEDEVLEAINSLLKRKVYLGKIWENTFNIRRNISYRNSFLPQIKGAVTSNQNYTVVTLKMRMHILVEVFCYIWGGGVLIFWLLALTSIFTNKEFNFIVIMPLVMLAFLFAMTYGFFNWEASTSSKELNIALKADSMTINK